MSVGSHSLLLVVLFFLVSNIQDPQQNEPDRSAAIVLARVSQNSDVNYLDAPLPNPSTDSPANALDVADKPPDIRLAQLPLDDNIEIPGALPPAADRQMNASRMANDATGSSSSRPFELTADDLKLIESDQQLLKSQRPAGPGTSISVFGSAPLTGRRFVFLIDRSHSMGNQGLGVLKPARLELTTATNKLEKHHQFQIVVYNNSTGTMGRREWLPATRENKLRVPEFLDNLLAFGGTNHEYGLYAAMAFKPDIIVMMTDGGSPDLHDGQIQAIKKSAGKTAIHAIQFGLGPNPATSGSNHFLKRLAEATSGSFRYVDIRTWRTLQKTKSRLTE